MEVGLSDVELSTDQDCGRGEIVKRQIEKKGMVGREGRKEECPKIGPGTHISRTPWQPQGAPLKNGTAKQYPKSRSSGGSFSISAAGPGLLGTLGS